MIHIVAFVDTIKQANFQAANYLCPNYTTFLEKNDFFYVYYSNIKQSFLI